MLKQSMLIAAALALGSVGLHAQTPPMPGEPKRFPQITVDQIPPEGQQLAQEILKI